MDPIRATSVVGQAFSRAARGATAVEILASACIVGKGPLQGRY